MPYSVAHVGKFVLLFREALLGNNFKDKLLPVHEALYSSFIRIYLDKVFSVHFVVFVFYLSYFSDIEY